MQKISIKYAFRIIDGIFVGNCKAPQETAFMKFNKINSIINCSAQDTVIPAEYRTLNYNWLEDDHQVSHIHKQKTIDKTVVQQIFSFVSEVLELGESILFCCFEGQGRCLVALASYLMYKFSWSLFKVFQLLNTKRSDFELRVNFLNSLIEFEKSLSHDIVLSRKWNEKIDDDEAKLVSNTFFNEVQVGKLASIAECTKRTCAKKVVWAMHHVQYFNHSNITLNNVNNKFSVQSILKSSINDVKIEKKDFRPSSRIRTIKNSEQPPVLPCAQNFIYKNNNQYTRLQLNYSINQQSLRQGTPKSSFRRHSERNSERQRAQSVIEKELLDMSLNTMIENKQSLELESKISQRPKGRSISVTPKRDYRGYSISFAPTINLPKRNPIQRLFKIK